MKIPGEYHAGYILMSEKNCFGTRDWIADAKTWLLTVLRFPDMWHFAWTAKSNVLPLLSWIWAIKYGPMRLPGMHQAASPPLLDILWTLGAKHKYGVYAFGLVDGKGLKATGSVSPKFSSNMKGWGLSTSSLQSLRRLLVVRELSVYCTNTQVQARVDCSNFNPCRAWTGWRDGATLWLCLPFSLLLITFVLSPALPSLHILTFVSLVTLSPVILSKLLIYPALVW